MPPKIDMFHPDGHVEVLAIHNRGGFIEMYLHKTGSPTIIHDSPEAYARRVTLPHGEVFETRTFGIEEAKTYKSAYYLNTLRTILRNNKQTHPEVLEAFTELFVSATGYYYPDIKELVQID